MTDNNALAQPLQYDGSQFQLLIAQLTPQEVMIATSLVYFNKIEDALVELDISPADWRACPQERKDLILLVSRLAALDVAQAAFAVLQSATMSAVTTMTDLMKSEDEETRYKASRFIIEHAQGKAGVRKGNETRVIKHKHYLVARASPDAFDDEDVPEDDDDDEDIIEGKME
jgi:hypothetical protein